MKNQLLIELHKSPQTVFTLKEISLLMPELEYTNLKGRVAYLAKAGAIRRLTHGVYAKHSYNSFELANKLYTPSYIGLETVLRQAGVTFQHYDRIFSVSYLTRTVSVDGQVFEYHQLSKNILLNKEGLLDQAGVAIASPERAFLDAVYLYKNYHFDNLAPLDWDKVSKLEGLYETKALGKRVKEYYQIYREEHVG
jgi:predicted transcriptional regulator of viral defense system